MYLGTLSRPLCLVGQPNVHEESGNVHGFGLSLLRQVSTSQGKPMFWSKDGMTIYYLAVVRSPWSTLIHSSCNKANECLLYTRLYRARGLEK